MERWVEFQLKKTETHHLKDVPHHSGPHPLTPPNLVKHVAQAEPQASVNKAVNSGSIEFGQLPTKYRRAVITEAEMEAIEVYL